MAAVLACGPDAVLSHHSAAALMRMLSRDAQVIHLSMPDLRVRRLSGLKVHRPRYLPESDVGTFQRIPVTSPTRTLVDLATVLTTPRLERAVSEAAIRELIDLECLRGELEVREGQRGVRALREIIDRHSFAMTQTELEQAFLPIVRRAGLPKPETQVRVNGFKVDFFWRNLGLVVETDGGRFHRTAIKQTRDRQREHAHLEAGLLPVRFTHWQVRYEPGRVAATLASAASRSNTAAA